MTVINPPAATDHTVSNATATWTGEAQIYAFTADHSGYWWAVGFVEMLTGSGVQTIRLRFAGAQVAIATFDMGAPGNHIYTDPPVHYLGLITAGQTIQLTGQAASGAGQNTPSSSLWCGFVPAPGYIR